MNDEIKILIACHNNGDFVKNDVIMPIFCGAEIEHSSPNMLLDNDGDNISKKNYFYNEMTAIYWAWKNYEKLKSPQYIGFMHYRRYFIFNKIFENSKIETLKYYDKEKIELYGCEYKCIKKEVEKYDFCFIKPLQNGMSNYEQFKSKHSICLLDKALKIVLCKNPDMKCSLNNYFHEYNDGIFFNMFIMKKEIFFEYAKWIFDILFELEKNIDLKNETKSNMRILAFVAERLTGFYLYYLSQREKRYKTFPLLYIEKPEFEMNICPSFSENNIAIAIPSDDNYAPFLSIAIISILHNASYNYNYDIYVLDDNISEKNKKIITDSIKQKNVKITFIDVEGYMQDVDQDIFYLHSHFKKSTYYRFFIPKIFSSFEKILYLDSDMIILDDVEKLFSTNIEKYLLSASIDVEAVRLYKTSKQFKNYFIDELKIKNIYKYFQAGVILFNIRKMLDLNITEKCLNTLKIVKKPFFFDQDILNIVCQSNVSFFDISWNILWHVNFQSKLIDSVPWSIVKRYEHAKQRPKIIHFCSVWKPWKEPERELAHYFWEYARKSPFYESIIHKYLLLNNAISQKNESNFKINTIAFSTPKITLWLKLLYLFSKARAEISLIKRSQAFDSHYYLCQNKDVAREGICPIKHYVLYGVLDGRDPNSWFSTSQYLNRNKDVKQSHMNPFLHYILYGVNENRKL